MKCNVVLLASVLLGQSAMASNIYRPESVAHGHFHVRGVNNGTSPFPSGSGVSGSAPKPTKSCTKKASATLSTSTKKPCTKSKSSSAAVVTSAPAATSASSSTEIVTITETDHTTVTSIVTITPTDVVSASASTSAFTSLNEQVPGTSSFVPEPTSASSSKAATVPPYPTTLATAGSSTSLAGTGYASGTGAAYPSGTGAASIKEFYRCGGIGYTGPTACVEGTVCKVQNPYYSQCVDARYA